jgi:hypothetical protein
MLLTNNSDSIRNKPVLDILLFTISREQPELRLVGKGDKLVIYPDNQLWSIEGKFNVELTPPYEIYAVYHPIKSRVTPTDMRDVLLMGSVVGPTYPKESQIAPFLEGKVNHLYRVNNWKDVNGMLPVEIARKINQPYKFIDLVKASDLEEISLSLTPTKKSSKKASSTPPSEEPTNA